MIFCSLDLLEGGYIFRIDVILEEIGFNLIVEKRCLKYFNFLIFI